LNSYFAAKEGMLSSIFQKWYRFYLSLDGSGLHFFENKFSISSAFFIAVDDFNEVYNDLGKPISVEQSQTASKTLNEDLHNTILFTASGDEVYMR
jgi:hypothetical protein